MPGATGTVSCVGYDFSDEGTKRQVSSFRTSTTPSTCCVRQHGRQPARSERELVGHILTYLTVNTFLVVIWYLTGAGFFWPAFPIFGWGIGVVLHAWDVLTPQPSEAAVRTTMDRIARRR